MLQHVRHHKYRPSMSNAFTDTTILGVYAWVIQEKYTQEQPLFDWSSPGFTEGFFVIMLWSFAQQALQNWMYYLLATSTDNISELTRFAGILRGQESFAQAVSYGINVKEWYGGRVPLAVNTILLGQSLPGSIFQR